LARLAARVVFVSAVLWARAGRAADPLPASDPAAPVAEQRAADEGDFVTRRYEPAVLPIIGGNSDIGLQLGVAATLSRFADGIVPYAWNMDLVVSLSFKGTPTGTELAQQSYVWDIDVPGLAGGRLRLNPFAEFRRTVNQGYFGLGDASNGVRPPGSDSRYFQYQHVEGNARLIARYELEGPLYLLSSTIGRYVNPSAYPGSKLAADESAVAGNGSRLLYGIEPLAIASEGAGIVYDSRDSEIFPREGWFDQLGARYSQGFPLHADVQYGETEATIARYTRLPGPFVLATQLAADLKFGHVPFFELFTGGVFLPDYMIGGSASIRGVPFGRYLGEIKAVGNIELRALLIRTHLFGQTFQFGNDVFADAGRVWNDYSFRSPLYGRGSGIKWGVGVGEYFLWGQAAMFRLELAYSPDAESENPGFPFGIYISDGVSF